MLSVSRVLEVTAHGRRGDFYVFGEFLLDLLHAVVVGHHLRHPRADFGQGLVDHLLEPFAGACRHDPVVDAGVDFRCHHACRHFYGVQIGLMQKQTLHCNLLRHIAVRVADDVVAFLLHLLVCFFDFRLPDGLVADHPHHFFGHIVGGAMCHKRYGSHGDHAAH